MAGFNLNKPQTSDEGKTNDGKQEAAAGVSISAAKESPAAEGVANAPGAGPAERIWSCHPARTYNFGKFKFRDSVLKLSDPSEIADFEELLAQLKKQNKREWGRFKEISVARASDIVRDRLKQSLATKQFDSSVGRQLETLGGEPVVGTKPLEETQTKDS